MSDDKQALRRMIQDRKMARQAGAKSDAREISEKIQKEMKSIDRARRSAKVQKILDDFRDLKRLDKTRTRKATHLIGSIRETDGTIKEDHTDIANVFADFYKTLYADANKIFQDVAQMQGAHTSPIDDFTQEEVTTQLKNMGKGKCADESGIVAEIIIHGGVELATEIASIFSDVLQNRNKVPSYWKLSKISLLFKKGDKQLPENYRPISITPILYRLFSKVLLKRIRTKLEAAQSKDQAGFRPGFGCLDHIFALTSLVEKSNEFGKPMRIAAIDFKKAFDSVSQAAIWEALVEQGVEPVYVELLQRLHEGQQATVQTDQRSNPFPIQRGTKQGDPISPMQRRRRTLHGETEEDLGREEIRHEGRQLRGQGPRHEPKVRRRHSPDRDIAAADQVDAGRRGEGSRTRGASAASRQDKDPT
jgi:hypothetical protein